MYQDFGTPKTICFPFGTNRKCINLGVQIFKHIMVYKRKRANLIMRNSRSLTFSVVKTRGRIYVTYVSKENNLGPDDKVFLES